MKSSLKPLDLLVIVSASSTISLLSVTGLIQARADAVIGEPISKSLICIHILEVSI